MSIKILDLISLLIVATFVTFSARERGRSMSAIRSAVNRGKQVFCLPGFRYFERWSKAQKNVRKGKSLSAHQSAKPQAVV